MLENTNMRVAIPMCEKTSFFSAFSKPHSCFAKADLPVIEMQRIFGPNVC
jgi:hypothetical protein